MFAVQDESPVDQSSFDELRAQALHTLRFIVYFLAAFTVFQTASYYLFARTDLLNQPFGYVSVTLNLGLLVAFSLFFLINRAAEKFHLDKTRIYYVSMNGMTLFTNFIWLCHIHLAGSSITILIILIPATAFVVSGYLGSWEAWIHLGIGLAGYLGLIILERNGLLPFFPLYRHSAELPAQFLLSARYTIINMVMLIALSVVVLLLLIRLQRDLRQRNRELAQAKKKLEILARTDSLTGLINRRTVMELAERELSRVRRQKQHLAMVMADIDNFKQVNDTYGHAVGDIVLRETAQLLQHNFRPYDLVARIGGEEFLIVIAEVDANKGIDLAERTRVAIANHDIRIDEATQLQITTSFGCTTFNPDQPKSFDLLLKDADDALYVSKKHGKNRVTHKV
ncbi:MAG: GGDEF domain-containing protein [Myxococcales bacterium]|nr:GGDEF domain-containing protein [Myxococcales bacterium]